MAVALLVAGVGLENNAAGAITGATGGVLYLQPLGAELPEEDVTLAVAALRTFYGVAIRVLPRAELPAGSFYAPRGRYRADKVLDYLEEAGRRPRDARFVLALTAVDISTTKGKILDWGILGLARIDGHAAVISTFRCQKGARGPQHARERFAKVAVHEVGHNLGLDHCPVRGCLMQDAAGKVKTSDGEYDLCSRCRQRLAETGVHLPTAQPPWPRPAGR